MRIAILADPLDNQRAGVHTYTREMVHGLIRHNRGHEIILIREKVDPSLLGVEQISVPNVRLPIGFSSIRLFLWIPYLIRKHKVDVAIEPAHFGPFNLPKSIRRITMIHDLTPIILPQYHRYHSQLLQRIFLKRILKNADTILSNSKNTSKDIHQIYPFTKGKISTILLGKDTMYKPMYDAYILDRYNINSPYFLNVGTIEPRKNLLTLLKAFASYRSSHPVDTKLVIVGQMGWKSESFQTALEDHPYKEDICLPGYVDQADMPVLYTSAAAMIYPSEYEGFGLPILEALACGCPVICANNSSLPEVGGQLAAYFETFDPDDLLKQMEIITSDDFNRPSFRDKAVQWANTFSWDRYADELMDVLEA